MGRRKSAKQIEKELQYARAREAYNPPVREDGASTRKNPLIAVAYKPIQIAAGETAKKYKVQASQKSVVFFGQTALNLVDAGSEDPLPRGAKPAKVHATVSDDSPNIIRALGSNRPYKRYAPGNRGSNTQYSYTAPLSIQSAAALDNEVKTVFNAVKGKLGGAYGRVWFTPEYFVLTGSGE
ncbi:hypothetical protein [Halotia branconii]|uniref:Uncharacterized protein n=1 Tax=Halotia branconii CENA392 TaxID=1539056 RepID=A0AAJ6NSV5_9CYAN|nr:hypothetical protein [Halotia branconii]WGV23471.1 hypothetical protein QI031_16735 [Halotia branconii CENA392]WGV25670.1 hypothetical protein QI031_28785 [Halotia branconii CENA392]WGV25928.1 hypothetical protein QI031_30190 [Halotia branconii CENA392]